MANTSASRDPMGSVKVLDWDALLLGSTPSAKKRRSSRQDHQEQASSKVIIDRSKGDSGYAQASGDPDPSNFLTLTDPDLLDCPICFNNLSIPVFQCLNGHLACSSCCIKVRNKCPSCSSTIGHNRCRAIEKIIDSVRTSCRNKKYGCTEMVFRCKKRDHEDVCLYAPCSCPLPDCDFIGCSPDLSVHFSTEHPDSAKPFCYNNRIPISLELQQKYFILQEEQEGTIFVLNNEVQNLGNVINVCCFAPSSAKRGVSYDLIATNRGRLVKLLSFAERVCGLVKNTSLKSFLMVPGDFVGSCGQLELELRIFDTKFLHAFTDFESASNVNWSTFGTQSRNTTGFITRIVKLRKSYWVIRLGVSVVLFKTKLTLARKWQLLAIIPLPPLCNRHEKCLKEDQETPVTIMVGKRRKTRDSSDRHGKELLSPSPTSDNIRKKLAMARKEKTIHVGNGEEDSQAPIGNEMSKQTLAQRARRERERILKQSTIRRSEQHLPGDPSVQPLRDSNIVVHVQERKPRGEEIQMANNTSAPGNLSEMSLINELLLQPQMLLKDLKSLCSSPSTKKRRTAGQDEGKEQQAAPSKVIGACSNCDRGSNFLALTDPDLLDCPVCFNNLTIPVFQCLNGHLACSSCCIKVRNKCPSCSSTIGHNRCRPIEKIIESVKTSCQNQKYGCTEMVFRCKKREHEDMCVYAPCSCPLPDCEFVGSSKKLSLHFSTKHSGSAKRFCYNCSIPISLELRQKSVILQEEQEGSIYILNNGVQNLGNVIDVCCIAPISSKRGLSYDLIATNGGISVKLQSFTEHVCGRVEHTSPKNFLMVPSDFFGSCGQLKLELRISEGPGVVHG
ncbi:uncharacterized protein LOC131298524 [Rhododendron vialii]|uniref:uncharacterized protein LOC131298524 n=1 Tax=Rhododendron vialii TaxID=182163 RepID=UPI00265D8655|nr:uncharacterized protein LOC131298524 [Rhododendron vialii]